MGGLEKMMKHGVPILLFCLLFTAGVGAGTYKWVDEDGNVIYSQQPPAEGQYESLHVKPSPRQSKGSTSAGKKSRQYLEDATKQRENDAKLKAEVKKSHELRQKNCATAKKQLEFYTVYRRKKDKNGEYVRIPDEERQAGLNEAKTAIKEFCD